MTDSLGLPRVKPSRIEDDVVWVNRVAREVGEPCQFFFYTVGGLHTNMLVHNLGTTFGAFSPDIIVLQIGIVDCAAKALRETERKLVEHLPSLVQRPLHSFIRRNYARIIEFRDVTYVPLEDFRRNLRTLRDAFPRCEFAVVPIGAPNLEYKSKNPLIERNITLYNTALHDVFGAHFLGDTFEGKDLERTYLADNHHLSDYGHALVATEVTTRLRALLTDANAPAFTHRAATSAD